jgi:hypothetical protein
MGQLLFKKCFWDAIREGTKRTTVRRWRAARVKPGGRAWAPGVGWLTILSVDVVRSLEQLTDADAIADGFTTAADMRKVLREIYPNSSGDGRQWFRVEFATEAAPVAREQGRLFVE